MTAAATGPRPFPLRIPFVEALGFELWDFADGRAELRLDLAASHLNSWDVAHGGVVMTLLDVAMAHAARSAGVKPGADAPADAAVSDMRGMATIEMKTSFMRPGEGRLRCIATLIHRTATMAFCEARVVDERDRLCAHATGTFKYLRAMPATPHRANPLQTASPESPT